MRLYSCWRAARSADVSDPGTGSGLLAPWPRMATVACSMPASVYTRVARKRKFSTLSLPSAVDNASFASFHHRAWMNVGAYRYVCRNTECR